MAKIINPFKTLTVKNETSKDDMKQFVQKFDKICVKTNEHNAEDSGDSYILSLCGTQSETDFRIGATLSNNDCFFYNVGETNITKVTSIHEFQSSVLGSKFSPTSKQIVYVATSTKIYSYDLRAKCCLVGHYDADLDKKRILSSFDLNCDDRLLAAGTEQLNGDTFILFWDARNWKMPLGGYWQSHVEEVTSLAFHPTKAESLASGSMDGLINIYDLSQTTEDAALSYSLNTECSVDRIGWYNDDKIWCVEYNELQLWDYDGAHPFAKYVRQSSQSADYFVRVHTSQAWEKPFVVAGDTKSLKCFNIGGEEMELAYKLENNKQLVRDSWLHEKSGILITAGEKTLINMWNPNESSLESQSPKKQKSSSKISSNKIRDKNRSKPY